MENLLKSSTNNFSFNIEANFGSKERHKLPYRIRYDIMVIALAKPVNIHSDSCYALSENTPENFPTIVKLAGKKKKKKIRMISLCQKVSGKRDVQVWNQWAPHQREGSGTRRLPSQCWHWPCCPHPRRWCSFRLFAGFCMLYPFLSLTLQVSPNWDGSKQPVQQCAGTMVGTHTVATHMSPSPSGSNKEMK